MATFVRDPITSSQRAAVAAPGPDASDGRRKRAAASKAGPTAEPDPPAPTPAPKRAKKAR